MMRIPGLAALAAATLLALSPQPSRAQSPGEPAAYAVTYFDITPKDFDEAAVILRKFMAATRKEDGNVEFTLLDEIGRGGRFAIVEGWRDKAAYDAHGAAMKALGDALRPYLAAPFDGRVYAPLLAAPPSADPKLGTAMYVLTHIDVMPSAKDDVAAAIKGFVQDSRKDKGVQRVDALVADGHPNHFELIEAWHDHLTREAHAYLDHTKAFRGKIMPFEGAMYDERLYEVVR